MANALKHLTELYPLFNEHLNIKDQHWLISLPILAHSQCRRKLRSHRHEAMLSRWANLCLGETLQNCWKPWHRTYATLSKCCEYFPESASRDEYREGLRGTSSRRAKSHHSQTPMLIS